VLRRLAVLALFSAPCVGGTGVDLAGRRSRAPSVLVRPRAPVCRRPAPRRRSRRPERHERPRARRRRRQLCRHGADRRQDRLDRDALRVHGDACASGLGRGRAGGARRRRRGRRNGRAERRRRPRRSVRVLRATRDRRGSGLPRSTGVPARQPVRRAARATGAAGGRVGGPGAARRQGAGAVVLAAGPARAAGSRDRSGRRRRGDRRAEPCRRATVLGFAVRPGGGGSNGRALRRASPDGWCRAGQPDAGAPFRTKEGSPQLGETRRAVDCGGTQRATRRAEESTGRGATRVECARRIERADVACRRLGHGRGAVPRAHARASGLPEPGSYHVAGRAGVVLCRSGSNSNSTRARSWWHRHGRMPRASVIWATSSGSPCRRTSSRATTG
jgi:hypothetical protein